MKNSCLVNWEFLRAAAFVEFFSADVRKMSGYPGVQNVLRRTSGERDGENKNGNNCDCAARPWQLLAGRIAQLLFVRPTGRSYCSCRSRFTSPSQREGCFCAEGLESPEIRTILSSSLSLFLFFFFFKASFLVGY